MQQGASSQAAMQQWNRREYKACVDSLRNLEKTLSNEEELTPVLESKLQQNRWLARFASGEISVDALRKEINDLASKCENSSDEIYRVPDMAFVLYNKAVLCTQKRQLKQAMSILEDLFQYIDVLDEILALCICFLLIEVYIQVSYGFSVGDGWLQEKGQSIVEYLEKPHLFNSPQDEDSKPLSTKQIAKIKMRIQSYKIRLALVQENNRISEELSGKDLAEVDDDEDLSTYGFPIDSTSKRHAAGTFSCIRANADFVSGLYQSSFTSLEKARQQGIDDISYLNNIGCIHHALGKHSCAVTYFAKAAEACQRSKKIIPEVFTNMGLELLQSRLPILAYDCFMKAVSYNFNRPQLWLHVAECVAMSHSDTETPRVLQSISGKGNNRRLVLNPDSEVVAKKDESAKLPLDMGMKATANVLYLVSKMEGLSGSAKECEEETNQVFLLRMKQSALLHRSYLALCQGNWSLAYTAAQGILSMSPNNSPKSTLILAHSYCADSLLHMIPSSNVQDVVEHLRKGLDYEIEDSKSFPQSESNNKLRCALCVNMALVRVKAGDLMEPENLLHKALEFVPNSSHAVRALIYLYFRRGDVDRAKRLLKTM